MRLRYTYGKMCFKSFCVAPTMGYQYWVFTFKMNIDRSGTIGSEIQFLHYPLYIRGLSPSHTHTYMFWGEDTVNPG